MFSLPPDTQTFQERIREKRGEEVLEKRNFLLISFFLLPLIDVTEHVMDGKMINNLKDEFEFFLNCDLVDINMKVIKNCIPIDYIISKYFQNPFVSSHSTSLVL
uniref:NR LBD domain-containing protein n=1 Tax=Caenorhabditis tropicalis TaxID=1561998 RepID=A0A1I7TFT9_9PELO